jgi:hypothetical protein
MESCQPIKRLKDKKKIISNNSTKYLVVREHCKGNTMLHFNGNNEHFCNVDSYVYATNVKIGSYCYVFMVTIYNLMHNNIKFLIPSVYTS